MTYLLQRLLIGYACLAVLKTIISCKTINQNTAQVKVIGGTEISEDQRPSVRKLKIFEREPNGIYTQRSDCTMTFIKPNLALTAGHCLCKGDRFVYAEKERWEDFIVTSHVIHPLYRCDKKIPNAFDIGLIWFEDKVNMPTSEISSATSNESVEEMALVGYGKTILKITGKFWLGSRTPVTDSVRPSDRHNGKEFDGKHEGLVTWRGDRPRDPGFIKISAIYDVKTPITEPMTEVASAEGDSGGPAFSLYSNQIIGIISRGSMSFSGIGSDKVQVVTELIDLRRNEIQDFLRVYGIESMRQ
jgi:hypothetical protein